MERLCSPLSENQMTVPPNLPSYVPSGLSHGFEMSPFPDGLYGHFPASYPVPPTANGAVLHNAPSYKSPTNFYGAPPSRHLRRERYTFSVEQLAILEAMYEITQYPGTGQRAGLVLRVGVDESRVQVWFKNRRARDRNVQKQLLKEQRQNREMCFNYGQPEPSLLAFGMNAPAMPSQRESPEPNPFASEPNLAVAVQSIKRESPEPSPYTPELRFLNIKKECPEAISPDAVQEETDTTYTEMDIPPPALDQSVYIRPFPFYPFFYPYFMAEAVSSTVGTTFQT